jgi:hypothetical protein
MTEIPTGTLRVLYEWYYNPATDYRDPPEITAAWREIAERAGLDEEMKYDELIAAEYDEAG